MFGSLDGVICTAENSEEKPVVEKDRLLGMAQYTSN
jgi:hypothetical protein